MGVLRERPLLGRMLLVATYVLAPLALEAGSYLFGSFPVAPDPLLTIEHEQFGQDRVYDPLLFWSLKPGLQLRGLTTNSLGLRGPEVPSKGDEFRILSLGESTTYGAKVRYEESYSVLLERRLKHVHEKPLRVINAGVSGYTIFQGYQYLVHRGVELEPDVVLTYFGFNDFLPVAYTAARDARAGESSLGLDDRELFELRQQPRERLHAWLARHSNIARAIWSLVYVPPTRSEVLQSRTRVRVPPEDRWYVLEQLTAFCRERGIQLVIVVPWYREFEGHAPLLRQFAAEHAVPMIDLPVHLAGTGERRPEYFWDAYHPNAAGHTLMTDILVMELAKTLEGAWRQEAQR
ncbi:MAG: SGNH/GDSL hydrolase family protein [Myxococcota bacterium]